MGWTWTRSFKIIPMQKIKKKIIILSISLSAIFSLAFVDNYFEISKNLDIMTTAYRELNMY